MANVVTITVTVDPGGASLHQLKEIVESGLRLVGARRVPCRWALDTDDVSNIVAALPPQYNQLYLLDLNDGVNEVDPVGEPRMLAATDTLVPPDSDSIDHVTLTRLDALDAAVRLVMSTVKRTLELDDLATMHARSVGIVAELATEVADIFIKWAEES